MPTLKIYECCICHKILEDYKPIRLVRQKYGEGKYKQYGTVCHYDFCNECFKKINAWICKYKKERNNEIYK